MWEGKYDGKDVLIKFSQIYEATEHRLLTAHGLAPAFHQCLQLMGGGYMVIMERLAGEDAHRAFHGQNLPPSVTKDVQRALNLLHGSKRVVGDLRRPNIMLSKEEDVGTCNAPRSLRKRPYTGANGR
jgi:tRNA A-37 threonylcarbamoyl transferase component Bud32